MSTFSETICAVPARIPRITPGEALDALRDPDLIALGRRAHDAACRLHPEPWRTYVVDRNINYSNWCTAGCLFCNFRADAPAACDGTPTAGSGSGRRVGDGVDPAAAAGPRAGYVLDFDTIGRKIQELVDIGGTQVLMQGGLVPPEILGFEWYLELLRFIRREFPRIHIHAFSPPEIFAFHRVFRMPLREVLERLRDAGLDTIPGGGAEILVDRVRRRISPAKIRSDEYLEVMRTAHGLGMRTSITMMFGHIETLEERIEHLRRVRDLQDETGGFTAFICWTFQPENTALGRFPRANGEEREPQRDGNHLVPSDACDYLRTVAVARLFLDNIPNLQASWVTQGPKVGQMALFFGANDMGSVMMEENVVSAAGTTYRLTEAEIRHLIADAGWQPRKRDCLYRLVD